MLGFLAVSTADWWSVPGVHIRFNPVLGFLAVSTPRFEFKPSSTNVSIPCLVFWLSRLAVSLLWLWNTYGFNPVLGFLAVST